VSEARYRTLFDSIDEGFCIIEVIFDEHEKAVDYVFLEINPSFERQTGLVNALGKRMRELAPGHEEHWFEIYGRIALTGEPARFQNQAERLHRWYDVYAFRHGEANRRQVAILFNNITVRKRAEQELLTSRALLNEAQKLSHLGSWQWELANARVIWSDELYRILGVDPQSFQPSYEDTVGSVHPDDRADVDRAIRTALESGETFTLEHRILRPDGVVRNLRSIVEPIKDAAGRPIKMVVSVLDVTEQKHST